MSKRRYVYTYSPRRGLVQRRRGWRALTMALGGGAALAGIWFVFAGGASHSDDSATRHSGATNASSPWGQGRSPANGRSDADSLQGGAAGGPTYIRHEAPPLITALAAAVIDEPCGAVLHELNSGMRLPPASLTKIATALVVTDQVDLVETVTVKVSGSELSASTDATVMGIEPGQRLGVVDLLYGMLLPSGNDAAIALAQYVSGSETAFVELMNDKAAQMGLSDTQFTNPHGLDDPGLYTSAYDIAMLGRELLRDPALAHIVRTQSYQPAWDGLPVQNHNLLLSLYPGALGVKTGYTDLAGQTLVAAAERNGRRIIVSVLGSQDVYVDVIALLDWGFEGAPSACGASPPAASRRGVRERSLD